MRLAAAWLSAIFASAIASPLSRRQAGLAQCLQAAGVPISPSLSPFNSRLSYEPAATVTPQTVQQVSDAVKCGAASDVSVVALSGGHSYTALGLGGQDGSLVLVMSLLDEVTLDGTIATVGAGTKLGNMAQQLFDLGERGAPHGVCPYVGIGGHAAAGGYGQPMSRAWGLTLDAVIGHEAVLADGSIIETSVTNNTDMFWALRGAGADFAIITKYRLQTQAAPSNNTVFVYKWTGNATLLAQAHSAMQAFTMTAPAALTFNLDAFSATPAASGAGQPIAFDIAGVYLGTPGDFSTVIAPLLNQLPAPAETNVTVRGWVDTLLQFSGYQALSSTGFSPSQDFYAKSLSIPMQAPASDAAWLAFSDYVVNQGQSLSASGVYSWFFQWHAVGGTASAISAVAQDATAYGLRDSLLIGQIYVSIAGGGDPTEAYSFADAAWQTLTTQVAGYGAYRNYDDDRLLRDQALTLQYGSNLPRLQTLKNQFDPTNVFSYPQGLVAAGNTTSSSSALSSSTSSTQPPPPPGSSTTTVLSYTTLPPSSSSVPPTSSSTSDSTRHAFLVTSSLLASLLFALLLL